MPTCMGGLYKKPDNIGGLQVHLKPESKFFLVGQGGADLNTCFLL